MANDSTTFELQTTDFIKRRFKCVSEKECGEWISAIRSAVKESSLRLGKRNTLAAIGDERESSQDTTEVVVILVSLKMIDRQTEVVLSRSPAWDRIIIIRDMSIDDRILISLSNGGKVLLTKSTLLQHANGSEFEVSIQSVTLASSLVLQINHEVEKINKSTYFITEFLQISCRVTNHYFTILLSSAVLLSSFHVLIRSDAVLFPPLVIASFLALYCIYKVRYIKCCIIMFLD